MRGVVLIVTNAGPLIHLGKLNRLLLLQKLFDKVTTVKEVYLEVVERGLEKGEIDAFRNKLIFDEDLVETLDYKKDVEEITSKYGIEETEGKCILLGCEKECLFLTDDLYARKAARDREMEVKGTVGILVKAFREGIIDDKIELKFLFEEIKTREDIWISPTVVSKVWENL